MKLLLDTHALIWLLSSPEKLPPPTLDACTDRRNPLLVSLVSLWEIQIKSQLDKMRPRGFLPEIMTAAEDRSTFDLLPITADHILGLDDLPLHHRDPFDRLLISQARAEGARLVSKDRALSSYDVELLW